MVGQAMTDGVLILLHVYFMVGGGDFIKSMASIPIEKSFSVLLSWVYKGDMEFFFFFLSSERGKMNRKEMEIETLLLQNVARDL